MLRHNFSPSEMHYLKILSKQYPTVQAASNEAIRLQAILNLPKGTEHFMSDMSKRSSFEDCSEQDIEAFDFCNRRLREIDENYRW